MNRSFLLLLIASFVGHAVCFPVPIVVRRTSPRTSLNMGALDQQPHESDSAYMRRLMEVASDASSFEKAVMAGDSYEVDSSGKHHSNGYQRANDKNDGIPKKKKGVYQRAEEWDAQRNENGTMTAEEKLQWECQRQGNRVNQNDILRHHLNTF